MPFYHTELQEELLLAKIRANPSLKKIFKEKKDLTKKLEKDLLGRVNGLIENFACIFIKGQQGSFKTAVARKLCKILDPNFTTKQTSFQYEEHLEKVRNSQPRQAFHLDEQCFERGTGAIRIVQEFQETMETLRKRQNSMIVVSPEKKYFPEDIFTYTLETIDNELIATCPYNQQDHEPRECNCYEEKVSKITGAKVRCGIKLDGKYIGFYVADIEWNDPDYQAYEEVKEEFMSQIAGGKKKKTDYEKMAREVLENPDHEKYKTRKGLKILVQKERPNLTIGETELVIEAIMMIRNPD